MGTSSILWLVRSNWFPRCFVLLIFILIKIKNTTTIWIHGEILFNSKKQQYYFEGRWLPARIEVVTRRTLQC